MNETISDRNERFSIVNNLLILYVYGHAHNENELSDLDFRNLDDLIIIAVEILHHSKFFDPSVLNPINYMMLTLLAYGLSKSPFHPTFLAWQTKIYSKLGCASLVTELCGRLGKPEMGQEEYEKVGCIRYSHYTEFLCDRDLDMLCRQYKRHFEVNSNDGKNRLVECFKRREFEKIADLMQSNSQGANKVGMFNQAVELSQVHLNMQRNAGNLQGLFGIFSKYFQIV